MKLSAYVFGLAIMATGFVDLVFGAFDPAEQPIQAFGDHVFGARFFACVIGIVLVVAGALVLNRRTARYGAPAIAVCYGLFAFFNFPRFITAPIALGFHPSVYLSVLGGVCQNLIVIGAACMLLSNSFQEPAGNPGLDPYVRSIFGASAIVFGTNHLLSMRGSVPFVPAWMPFGPVFWVALTGVAFISAGIAFIIRKADVLAARLMALMLLVFSVFTLLPFLFASPKMEGNWGANVYNIVAAASVWILSDWMAKSRDGISA
ncbi:MAG TPA: hypothetical protein VGF18_04840 [Candidatus Tumulicola sp.]